MTLLFLIVVPVLYLVLQDVLDENQYVIFSSKYDVIKNSLKYFDIKELLPKENNTYDGINDGTSIMILIKWP